jgi:hypothetical protein
MWKAASVATKLASAVQLQAREHGDWKLWVPYCRCNGIPRVVRLLRDTDLQVAASAAGTLQNIAREVASRLMICDMDCTDALTALLCCGDSAAQVCAAGALLNILGPHVSKWGSSQRHGMCKIMSMTMALASVFEGCFEQRPPLQLV